jgi:hypothetical protein
VFAERPFLRPPFRADLAQRIRAGLLGPVFGIFALLKKGGFMNEKFYGSRTKRRQEEALFYLDDATRRGLHAVVGSSESTELFLRGFYELILGSRGQCEGAKRHL